MAIYYLEMKSASQHISKALPHELKIVEIKIDQPAFNRFLYQLIGGPWQWTDKSSLSTEEWNQYVMTPDLRTWVGYVDGAIAGYFELEKQGVSTEIKYFGLSTEFIGKGLGSPLLSAALSEAWNSPETERVWVHTCQLDHKNALKNYQNRGFKIYKTEEE